MQQTSCMEYWHNPFLVEIRRRILYEPRGICVIRKPAGGGHGGEGDRIDIEGAAKQLVDEGSPLGGPGG